MDKLLYRMLPLARLNITVKVFARHDLRCQLTPGGRNLDIILLENRLATVIKNLGRANLPLKLLERMNPAGRKELLYCQALRIGGFHCHFGATPVIFERILRIISLRHLGASML